MIKYYLVVVVLVIFLNFNQANGYGETSFGSFNQQEFYYPTWEERELMVMASALRMNVDEYIRNFLVPYGFQNTSLLFQQYPKHQRPFLVSNTMNKLSRINLLNILQQCNNDNSNNIISGDNSNSNNSQCNINNFNNNYFNNYFDNLDYNQLFINYSCLSPNIISIQKVDGMDQFTYSGMRIVNNLACQSNYECTPNNDINNFREFITSPLTLYSGLSLIQAEINSNHKGQKIITYLYDLFSSTSYCTNDQISRDLVPIASASHTFRMGNQGIMFIANYYSYTQETPESIKVVINDISSGKSKSLSLGLMYNGLSNSSGVYSVVSNSSYSPCSYYYFVAKISKSKSIRYPTTDFLLLDDYDNQCTFTSLSINNNKTNLILIIALITFIII